MLIFITEKTGSRPIIKIKQCRVRLVFGWIIAWEHRVDITTKYCTIQKPTYLLITMELMRF